MLQCSHITPYEINPCQYLNSTHSSQKMSCFRCYILMCSDMLIHSMLWLLTMICGVCNAKWPLLMDRRHIRCRCLLFHHNYHSHLYTMTFAHNYICVQLHFIHNHLYLYTIVQVHFLHHHYNRRNWLISHFTLLHFHSTIHYHHMFLKAANSCTLAVIIWL